MKYFLITLVNLLKIIVYSVEKVSNTDCSLECTLDLKEYYFSSPLVNTDCEQNSVHSIDDKFIRSFIIHTKFCTIFSSNERPTCPSTAGFTKCSNFNCGADKTMRCFNDSKLLLHGSTFSFTRINMFHVIKLALMIFNEKGICVTGVLEHCGSCRLAETEISKVIQTCENYTMICNEESDFNIGLNSNSKYMIFIIAIKSNRKELALVNVINVTTKCKIEQLTNIKLITAYESILISWEKSKEQYECNYTSVEIEILSVKPGVFIDNRSVTKSPVLIENLVKCKFYTLSIHSKNNEATSVPYKTWFFSSSKVIRAKLQTIIDVDINNVTIILEDAFDPICESIIYELTILSKTSDKKERYLLPNHYITGLALNKYWVFRLFLSIYQSEDIKNRSPLKYIYQYYISLNRSLLYVNPPSKSGSFLDFAFGMYEDLSGTYAGFLVQYYLEKSCRRSFIFKCKDCPCQIQESSFLDNYAEKWKTLHSCLKSDTYYFDRKQTEFKIYTEVWELSKIDFQLLNNSVRLLGVTPAGIVLLMPATIIRLSLDDGFPWYMISATIVVIIFILGIALLIYLVLTTNHVNLRDRETSIRPISEDERSEKTQNSRVSKFSKGR